MKPYYVESGFGWFVVRARNKRVARSEGIEEWGRGCDPIVRIATDIKSYIWHKGSISESDR